MVNHIREMLRPVGDGVRFYTGRATRELDSRSFALFDRVRANPTAEISGEELEHLRAQGALNLFERYRDSARIVREFNHARGLLARSQPGNIERSFLPRWGNRLRAIFLPLLPDIRLGRVRSVYERFLNEENLLIENLSAAELGLVTRAGLRSDLERFVGDLEDYRSGFSFLTRVRSSGRAIGWAAVAGGAVGVAALNQVGVEDISIEESLDSKNPRGMDPSSMQAELIFTRCPEFPVMVRRRSSVFAFNNIMGALRTGSNAEPIFLRTLREMPCFREGHIRVRLKLENDDEYRALYRHLHQRMSRLNLGDLIRLPEQRAISEMEPIFGPLVPWGFDLSRQTIIAFLQARRALGDQRIEAIYRASPSPPTVAARGVEAGLDLLNTAILINLYSFILMTEVVIAIRPKDCLVGCEPPAAPPRAN